MLKHSSLQCLCCLKHVEDLCKNVSSKMHALELYCLRTFEKRILFNAFFKSQFSYCTLAWVYYSLRFINKVNTLHGKYLKIIHNDKQSKFKELLVRTNWNNTKPKFTYTSIWNVQSNQWLDTRHFDIFSSVFNTRHRLNNDFRHVSHFTKRSVQNGLADFNYLVL